MKKQKVIALCAFAALVWGCRTTKFDNTTDVGREKKTKRQSYREYTEQLKKDERQMAIEEELKEIDVEKTVVYVDRPVYYRLDMSKSDGNSLPPKAAAKTCPKSGKSAVLASTIKAIQAPSEYTAGIMRYSWDDSFMY